jgi:methionine salvage enolase-phosphatase E1
MKYLNKFNNFQSINEDAKSRAENKLENATNLLNDIQSLIDSGDKEKAMKVLQKATRKFDRAMELDPTILDEKNKDTDEYKKTTELANKITELRNLITGETNPIDLGLSSTSGESKIDNFDVKTSDFRDKIKATDFKFINKLKILGDTVSDSEKNDFLKAVKTYLGEYWSKMNSGDLPKEYQSPYTDAIIQIKRVSILGIGRTVFLYKEGVNDKIKLVFSNSDFKDDSNKDEIIKEIDSIIGSEKIADEISKNYDITKDEKNIDGTTGAKKQTEQPSTTPQIDPKKEKQTSDLIAKLYTPDANFVKSAITLLIDNKLNIGSTNTDEDSIYDFFVTKNAKNCIVNKNIDDILIGYRKQKSLLKESLWDDISGATSRATQSITTQTSKGVVGDLMNAFNSDTQTLNRDINNALQKIAKAYQTEINKTATSLASKKINEGFGISDILSTIVLGAIGKGTISKVGSMLGKASAAEASAAEVSTVARGAGVGSRALVFLANPWVWGGLLVVATVYGSYYLWNSFDEQQNQLATIMLLMWMSGSKELLKEFKQNGIVVKAPTIDITKLQALVDKGEMYNTETTTESIILRFNQFK